MSGQVNLGWMYENRQGVAKDIVLSYAWYSVAVAQGNEFARTNRDIVSGKMTLEERVKAQKLSSELWERYVVPFQEE